MKKDTVQMMAETIPEVERLLKNCNSDVWKRNGKNFIEFLKNISDLESYISLFDLSSVINGTDE